VLVAPLAPVPRHRTLQDLSGPTDAGGTDGTQPLLRALCCISRGPGLLVPIKQWTWCCSQHRRMPTWGLRAFRASCKSNVASSSDPSWPEHLRTHETTPHSSCMNLAHSALSYSFSLFDFLWLMTSATHPTNRMQHPLSAWVVHCAALSALKHVHHGGLLCSWQPCSWGNMCGALLS
jgi:hypothetical protein